MKKRKPSPEVATVATPTQEDQLLREAGFKIVSRPATGNAMWHRPGNKDGLYYSQAEALAIAAREREAMLKALEENNS